jgi:diguanylate cyclase (GGDEF)-like protein
MREGVIKSGSRRSPTAGLCKALAALAMALLCLVCTQAQASGSDDISPMGAAQANLEWVPVDTLCHATTAIPAANARDHGDPAHYACTGEPSGYQHGSLWLRGGPEVVAKGGKAPVLMIHYSRFDTLLVGFRYADGSRDWQSVRAGDFGTHWRLGGQMAFTPDARSAPLVGVDLRFDRLGAADMLRIRMLESAQADIQSIAIASLTGACLMLLLIGAIYNGALALAVRRQFPAWQAAWSATMLAWGALWSQFHLFFLPSMAGTIAAQICTPLSCFAMLFTTASMVSALEPGMTPLWLRRVILTNAVGLALLGIPLGFMRSGPMSAWAAAIGIFVLLLLVLTVALLAIAWRRGSSAARAFVGAWALPILVMGLSGFVDTSRILWGGGAQMLVLLSASFQTVWLSLAATRRFTRMRIERDRALIAQAAAQEQARRDPLTGLRNRRGLIERVSPMFEDADQAGKAAMLLLDVDHFKTINDTHGHDAGDAVLVALGERLARWDEGLCTVGRVGGEEFALVAQGMGRFAVLQLAESVRSAIAACDFGAVLGEGGVTVSVGVAMLSPGDDFTTLYRKADAALYAAKRQGRNRVVLAPTADLAVASSRTTSAFG